MDSLKGLVDTVKVNKIMLESNHGQPAESPIAQRKSITNLPCYKGKVIYHKYYRFINISSKLFGQIKNGLVYQDFSPKFSIQFRMYFCTTNLKSEKNNP